MKKLIVVVLAFSVFSTGCNKQRVPEVHKEGTVCYTEGASSIDPAGKDLLCKKNDLGLKRWARVG